jgi:hypothetical protein
MAILESMWIAFKEIMASPFKEFSIWWYLAPALSNGISLTWINIESMRYLFSEHPQPFWLRFFIVLLIMFYGFFIMYISFTHKFSSKATYAFAAPTPIYYLAAVTNLWGHGVLDLSFWVIVDLILIFPVILGIIAIFRKILPESKKSEESFEEEKPIGEEKPFGEESFDLGKEEKSEKFKF